MIKSKKLFLIWMDFQILERAFITINKNWYPNIKNIVFFQFGKSIFLANESMRFMGHSAWEVSNAA